MRPGRSLRRLGVLLMLGSSIWLAVRLVPTAAAPTILHGTTPAGKPTLDDARRVIPDILDRIYEALDAGRPQDASAFVSADLIKDEHFLDSICQPFTHRAHHITLILGRPNGSYLVRERVLFKPFNEKARLMTFVESSGRFFLTASHDDPFTQEKEEAKETVRQFIFASRASNWDVVSRYASPHLPIDTLKEPEWQTYLSGMTKAEVDNVGISTDRGVMLHLTVSVRGAGVWAPAFLVDPTTGRIVRAFYTVPMGMMTATSGAPTKDGITDPGIEYDTLRLFGLKAENSQPALISKVEPESSEEARNAHFSGEVRVTMVVDEQGNTTDITIIDSPGLGLDEKIIDAVKQWKFKPGLKDGVAVATKANVTIKFRRY